MVTSVDREPAAWDDPSWVLAVMCYPHETTLLERIANGEEKILLMNQRAWLEDSEQAARAGKVTGIVLATLYALDCAGWNLPITPSMAVAVHCAEKLSYEDRNRGAPRGHRKIEACYDSMRPVAHLWAAYRLHWEYPTMPHEELLRDAGGMRTLLQIACAVQEWALAWHPPRAKRYTPLLGEEPWCLPDHISPASPRWTSEPSELLGNILGSYRRRPR